MTRLSVAQAQARLLTTAPRLPPETVPLCEAAGRWALQPVNARRTQPDADLSAMDGYALRAADLPGPWRVIGESAAGRPFAAPLGAGEATRIFTGARLPAGADTILIQEHAAHTGDRLILTGAAPVPGRHVRRQGIDFRDGDRLIAAGARLTPARLALAATAGHGTLAVARPARVAIMTTGDELVAPGTPLAPGQLPDGNGAMLAALVADLPVVTQLIGIVPDRLAEITAALRRVDADLLVTTGGASVGDHDLVRPALEAAGGTIDFWRIAMRPGAPLIAGQLGGAVMLGLPGNPVSAFVTATLFLRPLIAAMMGAADPLPRRRRATLAAPLPGNDAREDYLRATSIGTMVRAAPLQDSSMLATLAGADCLIVRPPYAPPARAGDSVEILDLA